MVYKKRYYKKRYYKRFKKGTYQRKYYKRRYKKAYRKTLKRPEVYIVEGQANNYAFNNGGFGVGQFVKLTEIKGTAQTDIDSLQYELFTGTSGNGKNINGSKIRLKYLYIKGYIKLSSALDDDFNCKLMVFRRKRNVNNSDISWDDLINNTNRITAIGTPTSWTDDQRLQMLYMNDWRNDIRINFYKKVKNLYRKYDDANNIIPFKIRIPLYDCVLTCDNKYNTTTNKFEVFSNPSTNGLYFTFLSNVYSENATISYKTKIYYTDY